MLGPRGGFDGLDEMEDGIWRGSDAVRAMTKYVKHHTPAGMLMGRVCEGCMAEATVEVPWSALFCVANGVFPQQVGLEQQGWKWHPKYRVPYPDVRCPRCRSVIFLPMGPGEAQADFSKAAKSGIIDPKEQALVRALSERVRVLATQRNG